MTKIFVIVKNLIFLYKIIVTNAMNNNHIDD